MDDDNSRKSMTKVGWFLVSTLWSFVSRERRTQSSRVRVTSSALDRDPTPFSARTFSFAVITLIFFETMREDHAREEPLIPDRLVGHTMS